MADLRRRIVFREELLPTQRLEEKCLDSRQTEQGRSPVRLVSHQGFSPSHVSVEVCGGQQMASGRMQSTLPSNPQGQ